MKSKKYCDNCKFLDIYDGWLYCSKKTELIDTPLKVKSKVIDYEVQNKDNACEYYQPSLKVKLINLVRNITIQTKGLDNVQR
jgi:hypothetical protein